MVNERAITQFRNHLADLATWRIPAGGGYFDGPCPLCSLPLKTYFDPGPVLTVHSFGGCGWEAVRDALALSPAWLVEPAPDFGRHYFTIRRSLRLAEDAQRSF